MFKMFSFLLLTHKNQKNYIKSDIFGIPWVVENAMLEPRLYFMNYCIGSIMQLSILCQMKVGTLIIRAHHMWGISANFEREFEQ